MFFLCNLKTIIDPEESALDIREGAVLGALHGDILLVFFRSNDINVDKVCTVLYCLQRRTKKKLNADPHQILHFASSVKAIHEYITDEAHSMDIYLFIHV